jgi:hypothetical protein
MEVKEGVEKQINEIRICLNKISNKNYETQRDVILEKIATSFQTCGAELDTDEMEKERSKNSLKIATAIFDIASSNKFYSEIYADLYNELINHHSIFRDVIHDVVVKYNKSIDNIQYVDSNADYDGFCAFTKTNDMRRALATFVIHLMAKGVLEKSVILGIISQLQGLIFQYMDEPNRSNEIEEITENIFIFVSQSRAILEQELDWQTIDENIQKLSQLKVKEHVSVTSRMVFKYMDLNRSREPT